ncbi:TRAP transporter large permease [Mesobacterium pallidum]|uniref:TRAP transporter large permease n=1 Tax=Mesobacterium pallidum TaxID=2872037 RepID=UPI001EE22F74|nr:TRAP transporter large permease [Mesobacterium pallidum]
MSIQAIGVIGVVTLILLIFLRFPVAVAMGLVAFVGYGSINGFQSALQVLGVIPFDLGTNYALSQLPLFVLMGDFAVRSGMSARLYAAAQTVFSGLRGSQAYATLGASAGFGAVSGSSIATAATMTRVSVPPMRAARYDDRLSAGSIAAGGTLGILIPPSIALVVYAMIAEQSVPRLYAASLIPGLALCLLYCVVVAVLVKLNPAMAPESEDRVGIARRIRALGQVWEIALLFAVVIGGLYSGIFTATEAAAVGAFGAWVLGFVTRRLTWRDTFEGFLSTLRTTAMLYVILIAANAFTYFVVLTQIPQGLVELVTSLGLGPVLVLIVIGVFYVILGCFLEAFGMILITVPILLPVVVQAGYDPIWFGVFLVVMIELGMITPPVGMNIFVMQAELTRMPLSRLYQAVLPFLSAPIVLALLLILAPGIATFLPSLFFD